MRKHTGITTSAAPLGTCPIAATFPRHLEPNLLQWHSLGIFGNCVDKHRQTVSKGGLLRLASHEFDQGIFD